MTLHEAIAQATGWPVEQVRSFSLAALRDVVRRDHPELARRISRVIEAGSHITGDVDDIDWTARMGRKR